MIRSKLDNVELAERFVMMSEKFLMASKFENNKLDFALGSIYEPMYVEPNEPACNTIACHGGWGLVLLRKSYYPIGDFTTGARLIAQFLGFEDQFAYMDWATYNANIWGSRGSDKMFSWHGFQSFGIANHNERKKVTLLVIAQWYANVAARLLGVETREIDYE